MVFRVEGFTLDEKDLMNELLSKSDKKERKYSREEEKLMEDIGGKEEEKPVEDIGKEDFPYYLQSIWDSFAQKYEDVDKVLEYIDYFSEGPLEYFENLLFFEEYGMLKGEYYESIKSKH